MKFLKVFTVEAILRDRLIAAIDRLEFEKGDFSMDLHEATLTKVEAAIRNARILAMEKKFELGWTQVFIGEEQLIKCLTPQQQMIKAQNLRIEAGEFSGWRQAQIFALVGTPDDKNVKLPPDFSIDHLFEATKVKFDYYTTWNHRMRMWRGSLEKVNFSLAILMLSIITLNFFISILDAFSEEFLSFQILYSVLLGMLGASLSKAHSIARENLGLKVSGILVSTNFVTFIYLAIGATSAFIMLMLLKSHFLNSLFPKEVLNSPYIFIVISFLSGFSERWVVGILESATKRDEKNK